MSYSTVTMFTVTTRTCFYMTHRHKANVECGFSSSPGGHPRDLMPASAEGWATVTLAQPSALAE